ncbi:MAG TPA: serpin family protein [Mycobacteriales bacterium]|nr:serpin family protein [Mycobacteriales bacterium]
MTAPDLRFALALHDRIAGAPDTGFAWSPYSVASALGLTAAGARGPTRDELVAALAPDRDLDRLARALGAGAALSREPEGAQLAVANTLWADLTLPLSPSYLEIVKSWPGGAARGADFRGDPDAARREVNADVEHGTHGLIRDLIEPGLVTRDTAAVIVNALWLRASWTSPFDEGGTRPRPFRTPTGEVDVPTMRTTRRLPYAARDGWQVVSVPAGEGVVADVLLPDGDLADAEPRLDPRGLDALLAAAEPREVALELPRFLVEGQASLKEPLADMGVRTLFTPDADLSGVTDGAERLAVDAAVHKAVLTVDESGLEGAAATAVMMTRLASVSPPPRPVRVRVDHPFLVLVRHRGSGALYFLARVTDPR